MTGIGLDFKQWLCFSKPTILLNLALFIDPLPPLPVEHVELGVTLFNIT